MNIATLIDFTRSAPRLSLAGYPLFIRTFSVQRATGFTQPLVTYARFFIMPLV
jgi:hypothetical protein